MPPMRREGMLIEASSWSDIVIEVWGCIGNYLMSCWAWVATMDFELRRSAVSVASSI